MYVFMSYFTGMERHNRAFRKLKTLSSMWSCQLIEAFGVRCDNSNLSCTSQKFEIYTLIHFRVSLLITIVVLSMTIIITGRLSHNWDSRPGYKTVIRCQV